ncbi:MAG: hypothetical protein MHM6MM_009124, partial [Cercozoa sp. M6MM]
MWLTADLTVEVAYTLLTEALGFQAVRVPFDYDKYKYPDDIFAQVASGYIDINLEVWPQDHPGKIQEFVIDKGTVDYGSLGFIGSSGLYYPSQLDVSHPEIILENYRGFLLASNVSDLFEPDSAYQGDPTLCTEELGCIGGKW